MDLYGCFASFYETPMSHIDLFLLVTNKPTKLLVDIIHHMDRIAIMKPSACISQIIISYHTKISSWSTPSFQSVSTLSSQYYLDFH